MQLWVVHMNIALSALEKHTEGFLNGGNRGGLLKDNFINKRKSES